MKISKGDIVLHQLSKLYFICENAKMEKWMNENKYYKMVLKEVVPKDYFINSAKR